jgi:hypothetical protein
VWFLRLRCERAPNVMSSTLPNSHGRPLDNSLVIPRPRPAKVTTLDKTDSDRLSGVVIDAAKRAYGKQGAAAAQLGKDEGNFSRDVKAKRMTLGQLEGLGDVFLAELGVRLVEQFGALVSPKDHARRAIKEARERLDEIEQYVEVA